MRYRSMALALAVTLIAALPAGGQMATTRLRPTAAAPAPPPATAPAEKADPATMKILKRLEAAGEKYPRIAADVHYHEIMREIGDTEERTGWVKYQAASKDSPAKFRIHFKTIRQGDGATVKNVEDYVFDGQWFTRRRQSVKMHHTWQVAAPGEQVEAMELGKGPFPVPFGQKAETVLKHFRVTTRPPIKTDPKDTDYLKLVALPQQKRRLDVEWMEIWVDRQRSLPTKIVAEDASRNRKTITFKNIQTPKSFPEKTFKLPRPPLDWDYEVKRWEEEPKR